MLTVLQANGMQSDPVQIHLLNLSSYIFPGTQQPELV